MIISVWDSTDKMAATAEVYESEEEFNSFLNRTAPMAWPDMAFDTETWQQIPVMWESK